MKKSLVFFAAIAAFFSCSKENPVNEIPTEETFSVELLATAPSGDADTKTTLVDGDGTKFVHWSKGDAIKVLFFPNTTSVYASFSGSNGIFTSHFDEETSSTAFFRCDSWSWGSKVEELGISKSLTEKGIAVYPATATAKSTKPSGMYTYNDTEISFVLPSTQTAVKNNIESNLNFSYAEVKLPEFQNTISNGSKTDLSFKNACTMIELTLPSTLDKKVISISLKSNSDISLTGKGTVKLSGFNNAVSSPFGVDVTDGADVTLNNPDGFEAGAKYYVVVWPGVHGSGLTIDFIAEDGTVATKTTGEVTLEASHVKPYTFNKGLVFESAAPKEYDYIYADGSMGNDPANAVAVIFYNGKPQDIDPTVPSEYSKGLAISLKAYDVKWHTAKPSDYDSSLKYGNANDLQASSVGGYEAKTKWQSHNLVLYTSDYGTRPVGASEWYHGTHKEWNCIFASLTKINEKLAAVNGAQSIPTTGSKGYWIPFYTGSNAWTIYWNGSAAAYTSVAWFTYTGQCNGARPIFAF